MAKIMKTRRVGRIAKKAQAKKSYTHSAYWYATKYGWTVIDATTYTQKYFDKVYHGLAGRVTLSSGRHYADPAMVGVCMAADLVMEISRKIKENVINPIQSGELRERLRRDYQRFRRPVYYAQETARRYALMDERRKIRRRTTTASMPTPEAIRAAWENRRASKVAKIILGGMLHDLECYVDNRLRLDTAGNIVGRNHGIKGWIAENLSDLLPHYKALMYYKELAMKLRQVTGTHDPTPTAALLPASLPSATSQTTKLSSTKESFSRISEQGEIRDNEGEERAFEGVAKVTRNGEWGNLAAFRNTTKTMNNGKTRIEGGRKPSGNNGNTIDNGGTPADGCEWARHDEKTIGICELAAHGEKMMNCGGEVHAVMSEIFGDTRQTAASILEILDHYLSPEKIFASHPRSSHRR